MRARWTILLAAAVAAAVLMPWPASGAPGAAATVQNVPVSNFVFTPATVSVPQGSTVHWTFSGVTHTSTSRLPLGYWDSGNKAAGSSFDRVFSAAGTFPYKCSIHFLTNNMRGTVKVPIKVTLQSGAPPKAVVRWATAAAQSGYAFDVQVKAPGAAGFSALLTRTSLQTTTQTLSATGTWTWRSRVVRLSDGSASKWSPAKSLTV
jgi:plastocyanin